MIMHPRLALQGKGNNLVVIPGSFNPVHNGHREVFKFCKDHFPKHSILPEISQSHMFKPQVTQADLENRMKLLPDDTLVTHTPRTEDKFTLLAKHVPNLEEVVFVYGIDVYHHILNTPSTVEFFKNETRAQLLIIPRSNRSYLDVNNSTPATTHFPLHNWDFEEPTLTNYKWGFQNLSSTDKRNNPEGFDILVSLICQRLPDKGLYNIFEPETTLGSLVSHLPPSRAEYIITSIQVDLEVFTGIRTREELTMETKLSQL